MSSYLGTGAFVGMMALLTSQASKVTLIPLSGLGVKTTFDTQGTG